MLSLKDISTDRFSFDPKSPDFISKLESASDIFKKDIPKVNKKRFLTYCLLMYEPNSELRRTITVLPHRKMMAALAAGFELQPKSNKFSKEVEDVLSGGNIDANRMAAEVCMLTMGMDYTAYTAYQRIFVELIASSNNKDKAKDLIPLIAKVRHEVDVLEKKIFGGDEVAAAKKALYITSKKVGLNLRMEDIVERLEKGDDLVEFNEYPDNYKPNKLTYAGEGVPEEE